MTSPTPTPRRATAADIPVTAAMLARAFHDDPVAAWTCPSDDLRWRMLERFYATRLRQVLRAGEVWVEPALAGAALWLSPGNARTSVRDDLELARCQMHPRLLARLPLVVRGLKGIEAQHPSKPHWYLNVLGTAPEAQGRGIGSAVMETVLDRCDQERSGAYLESSKEANVAFYERHGFRVVHEHDLPRGPRLWLMWRDPR